MTSHDLATARAYHEAGNLGQAEEIYRRILNAEPRDAEALHLLGTVHIQRGNPQAAVEHLQQAIAEDGSQADYHNHLGVALAGAKEWEPAIECFQRAAELDPQLPDARYNLGNLFRTLGNLEEAVEQYQAALKAQPNSPQTHYNLANCLRDLERLDGAADSYRAALRLKPDYLRACTNLGNLLRGQRKFDEAEKCHREAIRIKPGYARAHHNLGSLASAQGKFEEAETHYRAALQIDPNLVPARNGLGRALVELGKLDEAMEVLSPTPESGDGLIEAQIKLGEKLRVKGRIDEAAACARNVLQVKSDVAVAHHNLGLALAAKGELEEAVASYREALRIRPDFAEVHSNLAVALEYLERPAEAAKHTEIALRIKPNFAVAQLNRAVTRLRSGDFRQGWLGFEWRRYCRQHRLRKFRKPLWTGDPLPQQTVLLHAEQGLGDTMQFIRYVTLVKQRVGRVVVECQKPLYKLLSRGPQVDQLVARGQELPEHDVQASLMSLPAIFGTTLQTVPAEVPYLFADEDLIQSWRKRLADHDGFKVGIAWQGSPKYAGDVYRSPPLRHFKPLAEVEGVVLLSLQKGRGSEQLAEVAGDFPVIDFGPELDADAGSFMDTAAIMHNLDLLITSDSSVAHLAGAMGLPVWVALNRVADWRWLQDREDSPWYPTMRLFRSSRQGAWDGLFHCVGKELRQLVEGDSSKLVPRSTE